MNPVETLEDLMMIPSHESVSDIREHILREVPEADLDESGCITASKGSGNPHIMLNTHMDVVPPHIPYSREDDVIKGRGACDAKASLAAMITAFTETEPESGEVTLVVSPDEETNSTGIHKYLQRTELDPDFAIVGEPTNLDICNSSRGRYEVIAEFRGESAHAASNTGKNAINCAAHAITALEDLPNRTDKKLGDSILTVTEVTGGGIHNRVPDAATIFIDYRSVPGEDQHSFKKRIQNILSSVDCEATVDFSERPTPFLEAFRTPGDNEYLATLQEINNENNPGSEIRPFSAAAEASYLSDKAPTVIYGPGMISEGDNPVAHSINEYVEVEQVETASRVLTEFLSETIDG